MRMATIASIAGLALSTAVLAQVSGAPIEQKVPEAGEVANNDMALPDAPPEVPANNSADPAADASTPPAHDLAPATQVEQKPARPRR